MARTKTAPSLGALDHKLSEVAEACREMDEHHQHLRRLKQGSEAYLDLMAEIAACGAVISAKIDSLTEIIEAIEDAMPDQDG